MKIDITERFNKLAESAISKDDYSEFKLCAGRDRIKAFIDEAVSHFCSGRFIPTRDEVIDYIISDRFVKANSYLSVLGDNADGFECINLEDLCENIINLCSFNMNDRYESVQKDSDRLSIAEKFDGDNFSTDEEYYGFYIFKSNRKEYFFISSADKKTTKLVDSILKYVFGAATLTRLKGDQNTYKYYANAIRPAKLTFSRSERWGDWADIEGTKSLFQVSVSERDAEKELDIVGGLV